MRTVTALAWTITVVGPTFAASPDALTSAEALKAFRAAVANASLADLAAKDFAAVPLMKADAIAARDIIWLAHVEMVTKDRAAEVKDRVLKEDKLAMPFFYKLFGDKPAGGRSLWISMHGGGNAAARVNDQQ